MGEKERRVKIPPDISVAELVEPLDAAIDGIDGYEGENGYLRYWNAAKIERARELLDSLPEA
jgi:hypothetical protein